MCIFITKNKNKSLMSYIFLPGNPLPNRIAPVLNASNSFNSIRPNFQMPRFQQGGISLNTNSLANGFSPQPIRSFPVSCFYVIDIHSYLVIDVIVIVINLVKVINEAIT